MCTLCVIVVCTYVLWVYLSHIVRISSISTASIRAPHSLSVTASEGKISVSWSAPRRSDQPSHYVVMYGPISSTARKNVTISVLGTTLTDILPQTLYGVSVTAVFADGTSFTLPEDVVLTLAGMYNMHMRTPCSPTSVYHQTIFVYRFTYFCVPCTYVCVSCTYLCVSCTYLCVPCTYLCVSCTYLCVSCTYLCVSCTYLCVPIPISVHNLPMCTHSCPQINPSLFWVLTVTCPLLDLSQTHRTHVLQNHSKIYFSSSKTVESVIL